MKNSEVYLQEKPEDAEIDFDEEQKKRSNEHTQGSLREEELEDAEITFSKEHEERSSEHAQGCLPTQLQESRRNISIGEMSDLKERNNHGRRQKKQLWKDNFLSILCSVNSQAKQK